MVPGSSIVLLGLSHLTYLTSIVYNLCSSLIVGSIPINLPSPPSNRDPENGGDGMMAMVYHIYISSSMSRAKKNSHPCDFPLIPGVVTRMSLQEISEPCATICCNYLLFLNHFPSRPCKWRTCHPTMALSTLAAIPKWRKKVDLSSPGRYREYGF